MSNGDADTFTLEMPGTPDHVSTARVFASAIARRFDLDDDVVEDLKLAVSEAFTACLAARESETHDPVRLELTWDGDRLRVEIEDRSARAEVTTTPGGWGEDVIRALFEDARIRTDSRGTEVTFSVTATVST